MDAMECIRGRRAVRKFTEQPVERDTIREIVEGVRYAPSWKNTQTVRYTVVDDRAAIEQLANEATSSAFNTKSMQRSAALAIQTVVTGICGYEPDGSFSSDKGDSWEMFDAGVSAQTFCLAAYAQGVGTLIMGIYDAKKISAILQLPENERVTAVIAMGYPVQKNNAPARKSAEEILRFAAD